MSEERDILDDMSEVHVDIVQRLTSGALDLAPYCRCEVDEPEIDVALPAYLNEAASEIQRLRGEVERLREGLAKIADGSTPPEPHGHYLAHRHAVKIAREAIATPSNREPG